MRPLIIAIAGGSASGKSTVVREIVNRLKSLDVSIICHDDYYKDQSHLSMEERVKTNYDHPSSLDNDLLVEHLKLLMEGKSIDKPEYEIQLNEYYKYISKISNKNVKMYLLSLTKAKLKEVFVIQ